MTGYGPRVEPRPEERERLRDRCLDSARQVGELLLAMRRSDDIGVTGTKSSATDIVTNADTAAEAMLRDILLGARPCDAWLGEETGSTEAASTSQVRWIVDPIDGTVNFLYDLPGWSVSVAAELAGVVVAGAVVIPTVGEEFCATKDAGATCNGSRLQVSACDRLERALVATGFSYDPEVRVRQGRIVSGLLPRVRDIRRAGAASVDFCALAAGRVDAFYEWGLKPWDRAAGALIAREAGAVVKESPEGDVVAAGPSLAPELDRLLTQLGRASSGHRQTQ